MNTAGRIIEAARTCLLTDGYAALSTRRVAERAGVPLSQIHYHFGGKQGVILALLDHENQQLVERQVRMYGAGTPCGSATSRRATSSTTTSPPATCGCCRR